jgi:hypothetical protein
MSWRFIYQGNDNTGWHKRKAGWMGKTCSELCLFFVKGPAADATDAPQPWGLLCNPVMKMINFFRFSL